MSSLIIINNPPYASTNLKDALDILLTLAVFELEPDILLQNEGVRLLQLSNAVPVSGIKSPYKTLHALPTFDISTLYIEACALEKYAIEKDHLNALPLSYELIQPDNMRSWLHKYQHCMVF